MIVGLSMALAACAAKAHFDNTIAQHPQAAEAFELMRASTRLVVPRPAAGQPV